MIDFLKFIFSKHFIIHLILALVLLAGGLYATLNYLDEYTLHGKYLEVPSLENLQYDDIDSLLEGSAFSKMISDSIYVKGKPVGYILEQDPKAGRTVKQGRKIYLTIAAAKPPQISMPDLVDLSLRQASSLMETYGLQIGELTYKPDLCMNCILSQTRNGSEIEPGTRLERGSVIDLTVGRGLSDELTAIPYLIGLNKKMASSVLNSSFLNVGAVSYDAETVKTEEDSMNAKVYRQFPVYTEEPILKMGSTIDLYLTLDTNRIIHTVNPSDSL